MGAFHRSSQVIDRRLLLSTASCSTCSSTTLIPMARSSASGSPNRIYAALQFFLCAAPAMRVLILLQQVGQLRRPGLAQAAAGILTAVLCPSRPSRSRKVPCGRPHLAADCTPKAPTGKRMATIILKLQPATLRPTHSSSRPADGLQLADRAVAGGELIVTQRPPWCSRT